MGSLCAPAPTMHDSSGARTPAGPLVRPRRPEAGARAPAPPAVGGSLRLAGFNSCCCCCFCHSEGQPRIPVNPHPLEALPDTRGLPGYGGLAGCVQAPQLPFSFFL